jgi:hypothetical protein
MKIKKQVLILILFFTGLFFWSSCEEACNGMGTLELTNKSISTVQQLMVDGINYGTIDPGESKEIELAPGEHDFQQVGISGGTGCSAASVIIVECKTSSFSCSH